MTRSKHRRRDFIQLRQYVTNISALFLCLFISACVANSTLPSQNIGTLLTPEVPNQKLATTDSRQAKLATAQLAPADQPSAASSKEISPAVRNSLAPETKPAAAEDATKLVTKNTTPPPASSPTTPQKPEIKQAKVTKPATKPVAAQKKTTLFAALAKSNQAGNTSKRASIKKKTTRPRTKVTLRKNKNGKTGLPGVRLKSLFGIDSNETEEFDEPVKVASVPNLARKGRHGLHIQRPSVRVGCFPRKLVRILKRVERKFRSPVIVSSGYRSKSYNRRVGGARKSTHVRCMAADIQVRGVSKWRVAKYLRTIPGRGGVGTYCHTKSVHIDIGTKRAWHHCKRRRRSHRKKS